MKAQTKLKSHFLKNAYWMYKSFLLNTTNYKKYPLSERLFLA